MVVFTSCWTHRLTVSLSLLLFCVALPLSGLCAGSDAAGGTGTVQMRTLQSGTVSKAVVSEYGSGGKEGGNGGKSVPATPWIIGTIVFVIAAVLGGFIYMFILQKNFLEACREEKQLSLFFQSPAGLPTGTVRSIIALVIILVCLYISILLFFKVAGNDSKFPEVLSGILGAVVGFYFGSRTATKGQDEALQGEVKKMKEERDQKESEKTGLQVDGIIRKVKKGIALTKKAARLLPQNLKEKYNDLVGRLDEGVKTVEGLVGSGNLKEALSKADDLFKLFRKGNPVKEVYANALASFGKVLGGTVPAASAITAIVTIGTKLAGTAYQKWKLRVLNAPFSPAVVPLRVVDASTGFTLLRASPAFKDAFSKDLEEKDWPFMDSVTGLLQQEDVEPFWNKYKDRFESREQFEQGLNEFRRAAADLELQGDIDPADLAGAGGYRPLMDSIDKIQNDPDARSALDALVTVTEGLHRDGEPVLSILEKVSKEVTP